MYNDKLVYKIVIWVFVGISLWKEKEALTMHHANVDFPQVSYSIGRTHDFKNNM